MEGGATREYEDFARALPWVGLAFASVPFLVAIVALLIIGGRFHAVSDQAIDEMITRDVGRHAVLLGPFAEHDWNHPGPAMFYAVALPYRLAGSNSAGLWIGALLINAGGRRDDGADREQRHGGTSLMMLTLLGCVTLMSTLGADFLRNPWNPYLPVLSFGAVDPLGVGDGVWRRVGVSGRGPVQRSVPRPTSVTACSHCRCSSSGRFGLSRSRCKAVTTATCARHQREVSRGAGLITGGVLVVMRLPPLVEELTRPTGTHQGRVASPEIRPPDRTIHWCRGTGSSAVSSGSYRIGLEVSPDPTPLRLSRSRSTSRRFRCCSSHLPREVSCFGGRRPARPRGTSVGGASR